MPFQESNKPMTEMHQPGRDSLPYAKFCCASDVRKDTDSSRVGLSADQTNAPKSQDACKCDK